MDGNHSLEACQQVTEDVLRSVFAQLRVERVVLEGMILKPNMILPGLGCPEREAVHEVADATVSVSCARFLRPSPELRSCQAASQANWRQLA